MNSAYSLKCESSLKINCKFPAKCPTKNKHKNKPVRDIQYFFASDDFKIADFAIRVVCVLKNHTKIKHIQLTTTFSLNL